MKHQQEWLDYLTDVRGFSSTTQTTYSVGLSKLETWLASERPDTDVSELMPVDIISFFHWLRSIGNGPATINNNRAAILSYFHFCCAYCGYPRNPMLEIDSVKEPTLLPEYIPMEVITSVLASLPRDTFRGVRARAIILLLTHCGLRASELCRIKKADYTPQSVIIYGKGGRQRLVPCSAAVADAVEEMQQLVYVELLPACDYLFQQEDGRPLTRYNIYNIIRSCFAGSSAAHKAHPHALRHTFATVCCANGVPIPRLQHLMGHRSPATTFRYLSVVDADKNPFDTIPF